MTVAHINRISCAVPPHDVHKAFNRFARTLLTEERSVALFDRMLDKSGIDHRYSFQVVAPDCESSTIDGQLFYHRQGFPSTAERMRAYEQQAFPLAIEAVEGLNIGAQARGITHLIITSCTGFAAPGLDLQLVKHFGLSPSVERTVIGFMGCYAAINGLKVAHHIVRSTPDAKVLLVSLELCTLHFNETSALDQILMFLLFADGCAAAVISAEPTGLALQSFYSTVIPETWDLMSWHIRDMGFDMVLSGDVPRGIFKTLRAGHHDVLGGVAPDDIAMWAVHPGGRTVLDAVEAAFALKPEMLAHSRGVLRDYGNMSSATILFVLKRFLDDAQRGALGCGMSFGPGLTAETLLFRAAE